MSEVYNPLLVQSGLHDSLYGMLVKNAGTENKTNANRRRAVNTQVGSDFTACNKKVPYRYRLADSRKKQRLCISLLSWNPIIIIYIILSHISLVSIPL